MDLPIYLAMTAHEFRQAEVLPERVGWMSCHFSVHSSGLSNLPAQLPAGSLLILDDSQPMAEHDAGRIWEELVKFLENVPVDGLLLDLQRDPEEKMLQLVEKLGALPCPVAVTESYGDLCSCGVFIAPCPAYVPLEDHLQKWKGRDIWLEVAAGKHTLMLTEAGCTVEDGCACDAFPHAEKALCCHYNMRVEKDRAVFSLARTKEDIALLLDMAKKLGVQKAVGLFQELGK